MSAELIPLLLLACGGKDADTAAPDTVWPLEADGYDDILVGGPSTGAGTAYLLLGSAL